MEFDGDTTNDTVAFNLQDQDLLDDILDGQDSASYTVSYYETQANADAGIDPLPFTYTNTVNPQVIIVRVDNDTMINDPANPGSMIDSSSCYETAEITLQVNPMPSFTLETDYLLCINTNGSEVINTPVIDTGLDPSQYTFEWTLNGTVLPNETSEFIEPTSGGTYGVTATDNVTGCSNDEVTTEVTVSEPPVLDAEITTLAFANQHDILVTATGTTNTSIAEYEFSLDGGDWELGTPNVSGAYVYTFSDVAAGEHTITVRDTQGCGESTRTITVMDYPLYFTPNGDGYHDTWNIYDIGRQADAVIYIFDRYGKLLKQLSPLGEGWDGTYNGNPMPSSDYWFTVEYREPNNLTEKKQFKAHFTLKR